MNQPWTMDMKNKVGTTYWSKKRKLQRASSPSVLPTHTKKERSVPTARYPMTEESSRGGPAFSLLRGQKVQWVTLQHLHFKKNTSKRIYQPTLTGYKYLLQFLSFSFWQCKLTTLTFPCVPCLSGCKQAGKDYTLFGFLYGTFLEL